MKHDKAYLKKSTPDANKSKRQSAVDTVVSSTVVGVHIGEIGKAPNKFYVFSNRDEATRYLIERGFELDADQAINKDFLEHAIVTRVKNNL